MRKKCRRKVWSTNIDSVAHAIAGAAITTQDVLDRLRMDEYNALDCIMRGVGTDDHWQILCNTLNVAECMALDGIGPEVLPCCERVEKALLKSADYYRKHGRIVLDADGIKAVREMIEYADLQQKSISRAQFERFIQKTRNKVMVQRKRNYEISKA